MTKLMPAQNLTTVEPFGEDKQVTNRLSSSIKSTPHLSARGLTILLCLMCVVPVVTIVTLWRMMPPVYEDQLEASVSAINLPPSDFYDRFYTERSDWNVGELVVRNESDQDWTLLNIQVNRNYQIYDIEPIPAHGERNYKLDRFVSRTGAKFQLRYNQLKSVRVYARRPTRDRATYYHEFEAAQPPG